jgi:ribosomal-protein-alanine N-acetyltransferase
MQHTPLAPSGSFSLVRCGADGVPLVLIPDIPDAIKATYPINADLYGRVGFVEPWVSYVAVDAGHAVGGGAFVGPPHDNVVEIGYFTLSESQGRGYATRTAAELVLIARRASPGIVIRALTLPEENASTKILGRLGFRQFGSAHDPDAGVVWEWRT